MTKTDLNNIAGMRDPQFTKENFGNGIKRKNFRGYSTIFRITKYLYLCAIKSYIEIKSPDYLSCFLIGKYAKTLERTIKKIKANEEKFNEIKTDIEKKPESYPLLLKEYVNGEIKVEFQSVVRNTISPEEIKELYDFLVDLNHEYFMKSKSYKFYPKLV